MTNKTRNFVLLSGAILAIGLATGLIASYVGLPVSLLSSAAGPPELQYVPQDAAVVAYANVREVMNSEFRQRFRRIGPRTRDREEFQQKTGVDIEQDIDSVVAAFSPGAESAAEAPARSAVVLARGRFEAGKLEGLALEHGGTAEDYKGRRLLAHRDGSGNSMAMGFVEPDLIALGSVQAVKRAVDAGADNHNVISNNELMRLVAEMNDSNAWAVGRLDAIAGEARLPADMQARLPPVSWFSAAAHINGGVAGVLRAEAVDDTAAQNLRDVLRGFVAMARLQTRTQPGIQETLDSLQLSGEGKTVALSFRLPSEFFDALEGLARPGQGERPR